MSDIKILVWYEAIRIWIHFSDETAVLRPF
jgi:hypothetical protein